MIKEPLWLEVPYNREFYIMVNKASFCDNCMCIKGRQEKNMEKKHHQEDRQQSTDEMQEGKTKRDK